MPTNVYGMNDNFDKFNGHVIPAMISKFIDAKMSNKKNLKLFGTGKPLREFIHANDLGEAIFCCLKVSKKKIKKEFKKKIPIINVGTGENISILKLSNIISKLTGFKGDVFFDKNFPDGTFRKNLNSRRIKKLGWYPKIKLKDGLKEVVNSRLV